MQLNMFVAKAHHNLTLDFYIYATDIQFNGMWCVYFEVHKIDYSQTDLSKIIVHQILLHASRV